MEPNEIKSKDSLDKVINETVIDKSIKKCMLKHTHYNISFPATPYCKSDVACIYKNYALGKNCCYALLESINKTSTYKRGRV